MDEEERKMGTNEEEEEDGLVRKGSKNTKPVIEEAAEEARVQDQRSDGIGSASTLFVSSSSSTFSGGEEDFVSKEGWSKDDVYK